MLFKESWMQIYDSEKRGFATSSVSLTQATLPSLEAVFQTNSIALLMIVLSMRLVRLVRQMILESLSNCVPFCVLHP
jgi:hypothetical protein